MLRQQGGSKGIAWDAISAEFGGQKTSGALAKQYSRLKGSLEAELTNTTPTAATNMPPQKAPVSKKRKLAEVAAKDTEAAATKDS